MKRNNRYQEFASRVIEWEKDNPRDFPWRRERTPYKVFISEFLLKRTTSTAAKRIFISFLNQFPDVSTIAQSDISLIENIIRPIGLYRQRSKGILETANYIIVEYEGIFPDTWEELLKIPHVGPYSAGCILSFGYGIRAPAVDSNVERVLKRCFSQELGDNPKYKKLLELSWEIVPEKKHALYNYGMIDIGTLVCSYRGCNDKICPISQICSYQ
jgi:A/G-specific adenine glycosylase